MEIEKPGREGWHLIAKPNVMRKVFQGGKGKHFVFACEKTGVKGLKLRVGWDWMRHEGFGVGGGDERRLKDEGVYEWKVRKAGESWDEGEGEVVRSLADVVEGAGTWRGE